MRRVVRCMCPAQGRARVRVPDNERRRHMTETPQPPAGPAPPPSTGLKPHRGTMILVFGILGLVFCVIFGIVAWVMGKNDLAEMAAGRMDPAGQGITNGGRICGMISVILTIVGFVIGLILMIAGASCAGVSR